MSKTTKVPSLLFKKICEEIIIKFEKETGIKQVPKYLKWGYHIEKVDERDKPIENIKSRVIQYFEQTAPDELKNTRIMKAKLEKQEGKYPNFDGKHIPDRFNRAKNGETVVVNTKILTVYLWYLGNYPNWETYSNSQTEKKSTEFVCYYYHKLTGKIIGFNVRLNAYNETFISGTRTGSQYTGTYTPSKPISFCNLKESGGRNIHILLHTGFVDIREHKIVIIGLLTLIESTYAEMMSSICCLINRNNIERLGESFIYDKRPNVPEAIHKILSKNKKFSFLIDQSIIPKIASEFREVIQID